MIRSLPHLYEIFMRFVAFQVADRNLNTYKIQELLCQSAELLIFKYRASTQL